MKTFRERVQPTLRGLLRFGMVVAPFVASAFVSAATVSMEQVPSVPHPFEAPVPRDEVAVEQKSVPLNVAALLMNKDADETAEETVDDAVAIPAPVTSDFETTVLDPIPPIPPTSAAPASVRLTPAGTPRTPSSTPMVAPPSPSKFAPVELPVTPRNQQLVIPESKHYASSRRAPVSHSGSRMLNGYYCDECGLLTCENKRQFGFFFDGWLDHGVSLNGRDQGTQNAPLRFTDMANEYALNQLYLTFGREVRKGDRFNLGFRVDVLYGSDYFWTSALGLETRSYTTFDLPPPVQVPTLDPRSADGRWNIGSGQRGDFGNRYHSGLSLPQFYGEAYLPVCSGMTFKAGHFYSDFGLESAMAPENTFYSHSYSFMYGNPVTVTGGTVTQQLGRRLLVTAGITRGWDIWDNPTGDLSFLVGAAWKRAETGTRLSWMLMSGRTAYDNRNPRTHYVLTLQQQLSQNIRVGLEHTLGWEKDGSNYRIYDPQRRDSNWASVASVVEMQLSQRLSSNFRAEWFRDGGYARIDGMIPLDPDQTVSGEDYFALTYGLRWQPHRIVTIRPEIRYDWSNIRRYSTAFGAPPVVGPFSGKDHLFTTSLDMILRF